ncbi:MAG: hypothetical protein WBB86_05150 [Candidatus Omnitrophota bacterium]
MKIKIMAVILSLAFLVSGCASVREKFVRKPKDEEKETRRYQVVRQYDVHPNIELYTKRYIFWKNWQRELLEVLPEDSHKKKVVAAEQLVSNLYDMKGMLVDEKGDELQKLIDQMVGVEDTIKTQRITGANRVRLRRKIESVGREIKREFSYTKVQGFIRDDFRRE